jgi:alcohol dehydrogenase class IV
VSNAPALRGNWNYPTAIRFGAGRIGELPDACRSLGMRRPLLVTDPGLAELPIIRQAQQHCRDAKYSPRCAAIRSARTSMPASRRIVAAGTMA